MGKKQKIVFWILSGTSFLCSLVLFGWGTPFLILAGILLLPIERIKIFLLEKIKLKQWLIYVLVGVIFTVGVCISPAVLQSSNNNSSGHEAVYSSGAEDYSQKRSETDTQVESSSEDKSENAPSNKDDEVGNKVPSLKTYVLNTDSKKIHYSTCRHVSRIAEINKKIVQTDLEELYKQGYTTCGTCF